MEKHAFRSMWEFSLQYLKWPIETLQLCHICFWYIYGENKNGKLEEMAYNQRAQSAARCIISSLCRASVWRRQWNDQSFAATSLWEWTVQRGVKHVCTKAGVTFRATWCNKSDEFPGITSRGRTASLPLQAPFLKGQALHGADAAVFTRGARARGCAHAHGCPFITLSYSKGTLAEEPSPRRFLWPQLSLSWRRFRLQAFFVFNPDSSHVNDSLQALILWLASENPVSLPFMCL